MELKDIKNAELKGWLQHWIDLCTPDKVVFFDGSEWMYNEIANLMVKTGAFIKLDKPANSYFARSDKSDVARVEERTYICSEKEEDAVLALMEHFEKNNTGGRSKLKNSIKEAVSDFVWEKTQRRPMVLPVILVYPFFQRFFTKGIMIGAVKG